MNIEIEVTDKIANDIILYELCALLKHERETTYVCAEDIEAQRAIVAGLEVVIPYYGGTV